MHTELIDKMGDDLRVANAARVSFDKHHNQFENNDEGLIKFLARENHWTPFSHVMITMRETVPIFVARQRFKHMVGFTYNEISRRYVDDEPEFYSPDVWRKRAENKKQGSSDEVIEWLELDEHEVWDDLSSPLMTVSTKEMYEAVNEHALSVYNLMIKNGVAPEQARMVLPQSMYTSYYCTGSLAAWARAYKLRIDPHAQKEIQDLANQWGTIITAIPELKYSWSALTNG